MKYEGFEAHAIPRPCPMTIPQAFQIALDHHQAGRLAEAEAFYRQILAMQPMHAEALHLLGEIAHRKGQNEMAVELINRAISINPFAAHFFVNLGRALMSLGQWDAAMTASNRAIQLKPNLAEAHNLLGAALSHQGRWASAIAPLRAALQIEPQFAEAYNNLGVCLASTGQFKDAAAAYRAAIRCQPSLADAHSNLGNALKEIGEFNAAITAYDIALGIRPAWPEAHYNKGCALQEIGQWHSAESAFRTTLRLKPNLAVAENNLGLVLTKQGCLDAALAAFRRAMELAPAAASFHSNLIYTLHFHPGYKDRTIADEQIRWNRQFADPLKQFILPHANDRNPERRLRIGYVSPDFRTHVVGRYVLPLFERHDRERFEILCYSGVARPDWMTERFRAVSGQWRNTIGVSDARLAQMVREDGVDILVDLTQHMEGNRLPMFARKPAPVQVSFAGYPESTGLDAIEYRISDRYLDAGSGPAGAMRKERVFSTDSFWCYNPRGFDVEINPLPGMGRGAVTFGCLNNFSKVNEQMLNLWAHLLARVNDSRLVILSPSGPHRLRALEAIEREGVAGSRVEFAEQRPWREYLELYHRLDIVLDTFPYNGGVTTCDALWMGLPVVSLAGDTSVSRAGLSLLTNLGLPELVAHSETEYVNIAEGLAQDLPRLAELRSTLRDRMKSSVLMDASRFTRNIEMAYREMWSRWCAGQNIGRSMRDEV
jgi:protein O-GlcNAc transferase